MQAEHTQQVGEVGVVSTRREAVARTCVRSVQGSSTLTAAGPANSFRQDPHSTVIALPDRLRPQFSRFLDARGMRRLATCPEVYKQYSSRR